MTTRRLLLGLIWLSVGCREPEYVTYPAKEAGPAQPVESPLLALTPTEYNQTIRDLFGLSPDHTSWWWRFPEETGVGGFEGFAAGQDPSAYSIEQLQQAAEHFSTHTLSAPDLMACEDFATRDPAGQRDCGWATLEQMAPVAWRRPLSADETARLKALYTERLDVDSPEQALQTTVAFLLQAPQFIYRLTPSLHDASSDQSVALDDYEVASRLSYLLWDSMPDARLREAASAGELRTAAQVRAQAQRMLEDWRAREAVVHFHRQWLGMLDIHSVSPARYAYGPLFGLDPTPPLDATGDFVWPGTVVQLRHSMRLEFDLFVAQTIFDRSGTFGALMTDNRGYMSQITAPLYGDGATQIPGETVQWSQTDDQGIFTTDENFSVELVPARFPDHQRAGVLTMPGVLAIRAHAVHPSPILRGVFVQRDLACEDPGDPGDAGTPAPEVIDPEMTNRARTEAATAGTQCMGCHQRINPLGFAFENYDALGRWRLTDNGEAVDATGEVTLAGGETLSFASGVDLAHSLAKSIQVKNCYVRKWAQVATGTTLSGDEPALQALAEDFASHDSVRDLLIDLAASDLIRFGLGRGQP